MAHNNHVEKLMFNVHTFKLCLKTYFVLNFKDVFFFLKKVIGEKQNKILIMFIFLELGPEILTK